MAVEDFSGYATRANIQCSDGRVINAGAFKGNDGEKVPLVWHHQHDDATSILGYGILEHRADGTYVRGYFNDTDQGRNAKELVKHGDIKRLSIHANDLVQKGLEVIHGAIREVSLVVKGANPGAVIENVTISHAYGINELDDEAIIYLGEIEHADNDKGGSMADKIKSNAEAGESDTDTVQDVLDSMTDKQRETVYALLGQAADELENNDSDAEHADDSEDLSGADDSEDDPDSSSDEEESNNESEVENDQDENNSLKHSEEGTHVANVFEKKDSAKSAELTLSHADVEGIFKDAQKNGSLKDAVTNFVENAELSHEGTYGIDNIDVLFPDAKLVTSQPEVIGRRVEWVAGILDGAKHQPFSRIKSTAVDLTAEEARAKGYVRGNLKKEEVIKLLKRVTTPTTVYKKQKLDRDDILDITELDVVSWLKAEMRLMLDEEIARAILIGDGREIDHPDKINEDHVRPIANDNDMYAHAVNLPSNTTGEAMVEAIIRSRVHYKGTGTPTLYTTDVVLTDLLLLKDKIGRRLYRNEAELAAELRVAKIVVVEAMESVPDVVAIIVNIADYTIGADKGGQISMFDDFDIDYNQEKYLIETRISGALTKPKSAVVVRRSTGTVVSPQTPAFNAETNTVTIPSVGGVDYFDVTSVTGETKLASGDLVITETTDIEARPQSGYSFPANSTATWTFAYTAA